MLAPGTRAVVRAVPWGVLVALCACNAPGSLGVGRERNGDPLGPPPPVAAVSQHSAVPPPHHSQTVLVVAPEFPPAPAHDAEFGFWLRTPYVTKGSRFEVGKLDGIAQASCFVSEGGTTIAAHGSEPVKTGRETDGHRFVLLPDTPLVQDRWYSLLIGVDEFLRALDPFAAAADGAAVNKVSSWPFFNGSAPRIVAVRTDDAAEVPSLEVVFSEPLRVTSALCQTLVGSRRAVNDHACESQRGQLVSRVHIQVEPAAAVRPLELRLYGSARGEGRSVAEAASILHRSPGSASVLRLAATDLVPCGSGRCWREPKPSELARAPVACP